MSRPLRIKYPGAGFTSSTARLGVYVALLFLVSASGVQGQMRAWMSDAGTTVTADFVALGDGKVVLRKTDGTLLEVPLGRLSEGDQVWLRQQDRAAFGGVPDLNAGWTVASGSVLPLQEACKELARRFAEHASEVGLDGVIMSDGMSVSEGDELAQHALHAMTAKWIRDRSVAVYDGALRQESEGRFRNVSVNLVASGDHADGYIALIATDPESAQVDFAHGLYIRMADGDRELLGLPPLTRDYRFLPKVWLSEPEALAPLSADPEEWVSCFDPAHPPRGLEARFFRLWLMQHLLQNGARVIAREPPSDAADVVLVRERTPALPRRPGVTRREVSAVEAASGKLRALTTVALVRERETEDFLRKRATEFLALEETGDAQQALVICRWVDEGQRSTLVSTTRHRHRSRAQRTREYQHRVGEIRVMGDCAAALIETTYGDGGTGGSILRLVRDQGEWKVWPFSAPALPAHRFSAEQVERLLELQEWGWEKQGVPEEVREWMRESG